MMALSLQYARKSLIVSYNLRRCFQKLTLNNNQVHTHQNFSTDTLIKSSENELKPTEKETEKASMSKAMKAYIERANEHEAFISKEVTKYEIGKRHLANMMGEDPETFTQDDIDGAIAYLLPSGLFEPRARPVMKHPFELYAKKKEAEFDTTGRPFHPLFYTGSPSYYSLIQEISKKADHLNYLQSKISSALPEESFNFEGSKWISKEKFEELLIEPIPDNLFVHLINSLERFKCHPLASREKDFILKYREPIVTDIATEDIPPLMYTEKGVPYMTAQGKRKMASAEVTVYGQGSGKMNINGTDILYFESIQDRLQVMFPLQLSGLLKSVDVDAVVEGGGKSGQAGAMRYGIAIAVRSFVESNVVEKMRIAGLLTKDVRKKERKKPGRRRARAKFTWRKR